MVATSQDGDKRGSDRTDFVLPRFDKSKPPPTTPEMLRTFVAFVARISVGVLLAFKQYCDLQLLLDIILRFL